MLLKDFYIVNKIETGLDNQYKVQVTLHSDHKIFRGHFPNNPVTPGVCMMQIIKELTENITQKELMLTKGNNIKFVAIINPFTDPVLDLDLTILFEDHEVKIKNSTFFGSTLALKLSATYQTI